MEHKQLWALVREYKARFRPGAREMVEYYSALPSLEDAIRRAALAIRADGKRESHQRRIPGAVLQEFARRVLRRKGQIARCREFGQIIEIIGHCKVSGIGKLTMYDTALRIGAALRVAPSVVYLHAGTRIGARKLGLDATGECIDIEDLPEPLGELEPREAEDFLCIYKDSLGGASPRKRTGRAGCRPASASPTRPARTGLLWM